MITRKFGVQIAVVGVIAAIGLLLFLSSKQNTPLSKTELRSTKSHFEESNRDTDISSAFPGFTMFGESGSALIRLVNLSGETVKKWNVDAARARLLPNCNLLIVHGTKWGWSNKKWNALRPFVREYSWDGEVVWEYEVPGPAHHDVQRLENGNTLILYRSEVPASAKLGIEEKAKQQATIRTDIILEVTPDGEIVWKWEAHEHLDLNSCGRLPCKPLSESILEGERVFDWTHSNGISIVPENRLFEGGDTRFTPGNIILTLRNWSSVLVISKESKEVVWKYEGELAGAHEGVMIPPDLPGAGNILIFNNGRDNKQSQVLEVDPASERIVWQYENGTEFFSRAAGVAQRLPNGNTLISEDVPGRIFEVDSSGKLVWKYQATMRTARARRYPISACEKLSSIPLVADEVSK